MIIDTDQDVLPYLNEWALRVLRVSMFLDSSSRLGTDPGLRFLLYGTPEDIPEGWKLSSTGPKDRSGKTVMSLVRETQ